ncbi:PAS domain-containing protein [Methanoplanus endosymbiosus]|uniref:PAS domain-containing protein n=1 Tax=Methanoplanus endosymbiosus TaxID=33865 RepID=A0A9E7PNP0_9EURY|nr:PAS domain-containing protein [Methanoplanus endosymbiosus]UUX93633.1 PAS domain-containing protein [Methanoplanus endosymbiosus]
MKENNYGNNLEEVRKGIIGLGEASIRKNYYPALLDKQKELERFRAVIEQTPDLVFIVSCPGGEIIDANHMAMASTGLSSKDLTIAKIGAILELDDKIPIEIRLNAECRESEILRGTLKIQADGNIDKIPVEVSLGTSKYGGRIFAAAVCRDVTVQRKMERAILESELQLRITIDAIQDAVVVLDHDLRIVLFNDSFADLYLKWDAGNLKPGIRLNLFLEPITEQDISNVRELLLSDDILNFARKVNAGDETAVYDIKKIPILDSGRVVQTVLVIKDVTAEQLTDQIKKEAFEQIDRNMEQFAILNDNIRNPLQAISGIVDLKDPELSEKIMPYIYEIDSIVKKLDIGWLESEKVRKMIAKHYAVSLIDKKDIREVINYLDLH